MRKIEGMLKRYRRTGKPKGIGIRRMREIKQFCFSMLFLIMI